ncbi:FabD/lysophospholipase-like protein [Cucurbitaria berberidis CBS 394.84]|uniref:FabD/lysophospholipase-like protein n=1 Tax=Cucurbitaria berberidis CBS 394.84 TaxID=1168544 RepID=A0A9P4GEE1_9PLEO|nr:FabD/lysophospholipase-like protein [Cucurbitaria berberidis CBS 394.84]KAF1844020.1 FabD/lysophospholipase-like protein [Cucurbitaria berberidis CBS 394.84]
MHEDDAQTSWFGIQRPLDGNTPTFMDYGRFAHLLSTTVEEWSSSFQHIQSSRDNRTPSLVSFVGQTGHGKSTLIKLLIDLHVVDGQTFCTPVVGAPGVTDPTSEDVHLYSDPVTAVCEAPIFFADCEGLLGGEREPISAKLKRTLHKAAKSTSLPTPISERELAWADSTSLRSRQFAVTNLYPRLLYTFSDVIVFVLKNPRAIEDVLEHLVNWADAALEMSSNQPVLPHVIIALNASENNIDETLWDPDIATSAILESMSRTVFRNTTFKKYAQFWRERKRQIETVEQLIRSYYSSIKVVRIPEQGRPQLIQTQIRRLYAGISSACEKARNRKAEVRMLLDAEELQSYLQSAFDHFARSLDHPFDFVQASFSNSPIPLDFGGNILKLAINLMRVWENQIDIEVIFQELSYMVASCIMLDSARKKNLGVARDIFPQYLEHLDAALENFCESHWPCEYVESDSHLRCVNVKSGHGEKGHQNASGKIFADGAYESRRTFDTLQEEFANNCFFRLQELLDLLRQKRNARNDEIQVAAEIHRDDVMAWFYRHVSGDGRPGRYNSHSVCFCCLLRPPEHALPCGHVLCTQCIMIYGHPRPGSRTEIQIEYCPLEVQTVRASQPWRVHLKPDAAGVRILTLDGGGIRGIVELEILQSLEKELNGRNGRLRIQSFFDLVVGTSTGGLIALGLVARNWSVGNCIESFKELCQKAFTRRTGSNIPLFGFLVDSYNHSKYETTPLHEALQVAFSNDQYLFGGQRYDQNWISPVKVAVTTTLSSTSPVLLANYNRRCDDKLSYQFQRAEGVDTELKTWEAARATSAAPRYFKPFHHESSKQTYLDGALYYNNPIGVADSEWKLIWGSNLCSHPDIVLSLGTGYDPQKRERPQRSSAVRRGIFRNGKFLLKIAADHLQDALDCEKTWQEYTRRLPEEVSRSRFVRYSPQLIKDLPALDDVHRLDSLQEMVRGFLSEDAVKFRRLAMQLIATSFYFETEKVEQLALNTATITGKVGFVVL